MKLIDLTTASEGTRSVNADQIAEIKNQTTSGCTVVVLPGFAVDTTLTAAQVKDLINPPSA